MTKSQAERITKASQAASLLVGDLRDCHRHAGPVESQLAEHLLSQAAALATQIRNYQLNAEQEIKVKP